MFRLLMFEHQSMVFSIALRIVADRGVAEEVAQDVFLELHAHLPELESSEHVLFWLRRVTTHRAIDALRRRRSRPETPMDWNELPELPASAQAIPDDDLSSQIQQLVASLPAVPRSIVVLRYQEEMGPEEIAAAMRMPVATVKSHLQRSLRLLREKAARLERQSQC